MRFVFMSDTGDNAERAKDSRPLLLKDLIRQVHAEIEAAEDEHKKAGDRSAFALQKITLEVNVTIEREETTGANIGAKLIVLDLKAKGDRKIRSELVHKVIVELSPHFSEPDLLKPNVGTIVYHEKSGKGIELAVLRELLEGHSGSKIQDPTILVKPVTIDPSVPPGLDLSMPP